MQLRSLAAWQGVYYAATGVWPLFHMRSFLAVTGPKTDLWLVRTVGLLVACMGGQMLLAAKRDEVGPEVRLLALSSAASLAAIDTFYTAKGTIRPVYLADAVAEAALVVLWARALRDTPPAESGS